MDNLKLKIRHYWIFLVTLICYCLGIIIHFLAQYNGTHSHRGKEELKKVTSNINTIVDTNINNNDTNIFETNDNEMKYEKTENLFYFTQVWNFKYIYSYININLFFNLIIFVYVK